MKEKKHLPEADRLTGTEVPIQPSTIGTRINAVASRVGGKRKLANMIDISESQLHRIIAGDSKIKLDTLIAIASASGVTVEWLATGSGPMHRIEPPREVSEAVGEFMHLLDDLAESSIVIHEAPDEIHIELDEEIKREAADYIAALAQKALINRNLPDDAGVEFAMVPHYDVELSAGHGAIVEREAEIGRIAFRRDWLRQKGLSAKDLVVTRVKGDSMEPTIKDGALVLVDTRMEFPKADGIYVIQNDGELFAKRVQVDLAANGVSIISDNPSYKPVHLDRDDVKRLYIIGKVVWVGQEV